MKYNKEELCLIWLDSFTGLANIHKRKLYNLIKDSVGIKSVIEKGRDYIISTLGENMYNTIVNSANESYLNYILTNLDRKGVVCITMESVDFPEFAKNLEFSPIILYAKGNVSLLKTDMFAIVGSRRSLPQSLSMAKDYSKTLAKAGFTIVSGIAEGVDMTALSSALEVGDNVISITAGGFDYIYPKQNEALFNEIAKRGLVLSELPPDVRPMPFMFPIRNRLFPSLARGVLVVSGAIKSGTMYTAEYTLTYGRDLFVIPYSVGVESGAGCNEMIKNGGILTDSPNTILEHYGIKEKEEVSFSDVERDIIKAIKTGYNHVEKLSEKIGKEVYEILPTLSNLEIKGVIAKMGTNSYCVTRNDLEDICN